MRFRKFAIVAVAVSALVLAGCSNGAPATGPSAGNGKAATAGGGDITVALVTHSAPGDAFWDVVKSGAEAAGKQEGVKVTYAGDPDPAKQSQLIDNAVAQKVQGIAVSMANPDGLKESIQKAIAAGVPVITINSGLEKSKGFGALTHVGQSEELAGEGAGAKFRSLGAKKMMCVIHEAGNVGLESRCSGAKKTFGDGQNLQVDISNIADAQNTIKAKLLADPTIDGILTLNDGIAKAAVAAKKEANSKAQIATFDVSSDVTDAVLAGDIAFAVDQQPYLQGYLPVVFFALNVRNGNDVGGGQPVYSGPGFVTKDNAAQVKKFAATGTR